MRLAEKRAIVTGAARGIGAAIAQAFIAEGARVLVADVDDAAGEATAQRIGAAVSDAEKIVRIPARGLAGQHKRFWREGREARRVG